MELEKQKVQAEGAIVPPALLCISTLLTAQATYCLLCQWSDDLCTNCLSRGMWMFPAGAPDTVVARAPIVALHHLNTTK